MQIQNVPQTTEFIHGNIYYRSTRVPAGMLVIGCGHKKDSVAILLSGSIKQIDGDNTYIIVAPSVVQTYAGSSRQAYAITDVEYATVTHTEIEDIIEIEDEMYTEKSINKTVRDDFNEMLLGYGLNDDDVAEDMDKFNTEVEVSSTYRIEESGIEGQGVFMSVDIEKGESIGVALIGDNKTMLGRYVNHSPFPNSYYNDNFELIAIDDIVKDVELTVNYRATLDKLLIGV